MNAPVFSIKTPLKVFAGLLGLLALSAVSSRFIGGMTGTIVALLVATAKMALIYVFFMRLRHQPSLVRLFAVTGFFWLGLIGFFLLTDYLCRT